MVILARVRQGEPYDSVMAKFGLLDLVQEMPRIVTKMRIDKVDPLFYTLSNFSLSQ